MNPIYRSRRRNDVAVRLLCWFCAMFGVTWLALILFTLFYNGLAGITLQMFTQNTPPPGSSQGGLLNAITGSVIMTVIGVVREAMTYGVSEHRRPTVYRSQLQFPKARDLTLLVRSSPSRRVTRSRSVISTMRCTVSGRRVSSRM